MRLLIQRVANARVLVGEEVTGSIAQGLLIFLGVGEGDTEIMCDELASRVTKMRIFNDDMGKMNLDIGQKNGSILVVSQFTLFADTHKGNRPSFIAAAKPEIANKLYRKFIEVLGILLGHERIAEGRFGANMNVELSNDGPVTIWVDNCC